VAKVKTHYEDCDILVVGGGMAGTGATFEARHWGRDLKIVCVEKANIDRSGAVAQGLYAINCYLGMQWGENHPEDHVRYARNDLMGLVREDLGYDMARHVDSAVHMFDEWGLPMMKDEKTGRYLREGKWQIMIHGESYKPIVAEAAKKSADKIDADILIEDIRKFIFLYLNYVKKKEGRDFSPFLYNSLNLNVYALAESPISSTRALTDFLGIVDISIL